MTRVEPAAAGSTRPAQVAVVAVFFVHGLLFASWTAHIPQLKAHLGLDDGTLGLALLGAPAGSVSAMFAAAFLIPRIGSRRMVHLCLVGYCLSGPLVGLSGSTAALFAALYLWGVFMGTLDIAMNTQAISVERAKRRPVMNGMHACWSGGAFVGAGVGTLAVALGISLTWQLLVAGTLTLLVAGWLSTRMLLDAIDRDAIDRDAASAAGDDTPGDRGDDSPTPHRRISRPMLLLGAIAFASMLCEGAAADWSSVYLRGSLGAGAAMGGLGYTAFALAMVGVRLFGDRLLLRYPADVLLPVLATTASVAFAAMLLVDQAPVAVLGFFVLGAGVGAVVPTVFSAAGRLPDMHPGVGVAAISGLGWAGFVCGPPVIGQLAAASSLPVALSLVSVLAAFIAVATRRVSALRAPRIPQ